MTLAIPQLSPWLYVALMIYWSAKLKTRTNAAITPEIAITKYLACLFFYMKNYQNSIFFLIKQIINKQKKIKHYLNK